MTNFGKLLQYFDTNPPVHKWIEEVLFRGAPSSASEWGIQKGVHVIVGYQTLDPFDRLITHKSPPLLINDSPDLSSLLSLIVIQQQHTIESLRSSQLPVD